jgi:hypothetical protein
LWYFLGAAVVIGVIFGLGLHYTMRVITVVLKLDRRPEPKPEPAETSETSDNQPALDARAYRAARQEKKLRELERQQQLATDARRRTAGPLIQEPRGRITMPQPASSASSPLSPGTRRQALLRETIMEHTDEEDQDSAF